MHSQVQSQKLPPQRELAPESVPGEAASLHGYHDRVAGCLLAKMCGDVLGAPVEGWSPQQVLAAHPDGLTAFQHTKRGFGCYTDDTQMAIALVRSLLATAGQVDDVSAAKAYAAEYQAKRGYGGTAYKILSEIQREGINAESIKTLGTKFIPGGSFGNGGAMRIAPVGLVYRHAPPAVLRQAVAAALRCTHVHPTAIDGAFVIALAVGYLATRTAGAGPPGPSPPQPPGQPTADAGHGGGGSGSDGGVATPAGLLDHLLGHRAFLETEEMVEKLRVLSEALIAAPAFKTPWQPWSSYFASEGWAAELRLQGRVAEPFQIRADDAAAAALEALCWHWGAPEDAVVAAVHFGGDTDTLAAITGAMVGALHGMKWIPLRWLSNLENGPSGRDDLLRMATSLAQLDVRSCRS